jgi:hypothetical protein
MLDWLLAGETRRGHLSVVPAGGWGPGESRPGFDQQPAEVAALADACVRAATVTGDPRWLSAVSQCVGWFLGDNDARTPMLNEHTGGGHDSLGPSARSRNQGARATLAMISVLQHGRRVSAPAPQKAPGRQAPGPQAPDRQAPGPQTPPTPAYGGRHRPAVPPRIA